MTFLIWLGFIVLVVLALKVSLWAATMCLFASGRFFISWPPALGITAVAAILWWLVWLVCPFHISMSIH